MLYEFVLTVIQLVTIVESARRYCEKLDATYLLESVKDAHFDFFFNFFLNRNILDRCIVSHFDVWGVILMYLSGIIRLTLTLLRRSKEAGSSSGSNEIESPHCTVDCHETRQSDVLSAILGHAKRLLLTRSTWFRLSIPLRISCEY